MNSGPRVYRGLNRRERAGWILGLRPTQALMLLLLATPVLLAVSAGRVRPALGWGVIDSVIAALVVVPVRGRPAFRWLADLVLHQVGTATGWSLWQSRAAAGTPGPVDEPDLPGVLARVRFPDGPRFRAAGRVCLIHDTGNGRWGATAVLTHPGVGMLADVECDRLADQLGGLLLSVGQRDGVDRVSLLIRTVPDDGTEHLVWRATHQSPHAPELAHRATAELDQIVGAFATRTEIFLTVSGSEATLRRPAEAAGGGVTGRAHVLYRVLDGVEDSIKALDVTSVTWLSSQGLAHHIRTGFNPGAAAALDRAQLTRPDAGGLAMSLAGPTYAPPSPARSYIHDGYTSVSSTVLMSQGGVRFGSLAPLLAVKTAGERRSLAIHYEVLDAGTSSRVVQAQRYKRGALADAKAKRGFTVTAADDRATAASRAQEVAVAGGHAVVRFGLAVAVTVPTGWNVEDHASRLENDAAGRFTLLRLELAQDSGFVAACLPLGIGLPNRRGSLR